MIEDILRTRYYDCLTGLDIYENTNSIKLPRIIVKPECRGNGIGTSIMNDLIEYADKNKQIIALTPASDFGGNKNRLIDFYKRFGFKMNKGHHKSYQFQDSMIRYPKINENKVLIKKLLKESLLNENLVTPPSIPNTRNFWHGGKLDEYSDLIAQKNGKYEFGSGLYLTTQHEIAKKYSRGNRKLYIVTVENGTDINDALINTDEAINFIKSYCIADKRKTLLFYTSQYNIDGKIKAFLFNNMIINNKAIKPSNTKALRSFLINNGIDYDIINNAFGFGEDMMVLYNMNKIKKTTVFGPKDSMINYNFETK